MCTSENSRRSLRVPAERMLRKLSLFVCSILVAIALAGCAPKGPPVAPVYAEAEDGPRFAPWLKLTPEQRPKVAGIVEEVKGAVEPVGLAAEGLAEGLVSTLRRCRNDSTLLSLRADAVVSAGELARSRILRAVNELHAILTPEQRRRLVHHLLDEERASSQDDRQETTDDRTESIGADVDLSWGQIGSILIRVRKLQSVYEDKAEPWLAHYRHAVRAFAKPAFDIRKHEIAEAPVFRMLADLVTDAFRLIVPLLEPEQCKMLSEQFATKMSAE
jgi:hypothetical protein